MNTTFTEDGLTLDEQRLRDRFSINQCSHAKFVRMAERDSVMCCQCGLRLDGRKMADIVHAFPWLRGK